MQLNEYMTGPSGWVMEYPFSVQGKVYFILKSGLFSGALNFLLLVSYYLCEYFYLLLLLSFDLEVLLQRERSVHCRKQFSQTTLAGAVLLFGLCTCWARLLHKLVLFETPGCCQCPAPSIHMILKRALIPLTGRENGPGSWRSYRWWALTHFKILLLFWPEIGITTLGLALWECPGWAGKISSVKSWLRLSC